MTRAETYLREVLARHELYFLEAAGPGQAERVMNTAARLIACEKGTGCGICASCRAFDSGNHPDVIRLTKAKAAYSAREIREQLVSDIGIRPYRFARLDRFQCYRKRRRIFRRKAAKEFRLRFPKRVGLVLRRRDGDCRTL